MNSPPSQKQNSGKAPLVLKLVVSLRIHNPTLLCVSTRYVAATQPSCGSLGDWRLPVPTIKHARQQRVTGEHVTPRGSTSHKAVARQRAQGSASPCWWKKQPPEGGHAAWHCLGGIAQDRCLLIVATPPPRPPLAGLVAPPVQSTLLCVLYPSL